MMLSIIRVLFGVISFFVACGNAGCAKKVEGEKEALSSPENPTSEKNKNTPPVSVPPSQKPLPVQPPEPAPIDEEEIPVRRPEVVSYQYEMRIIGIYQPHWTVGSVEVVPYIQFDSGMAIPFLPSDGKPYYEMKKNRLYMNEDGLKSCSADAEATAARDIFSKKTIQAFPPSYWVSLPQSEVGEYGIRIELIDLSYVFKDRPPTENALGSFNAQLSLNALTFNDQGNAVRVFSTKAIKPGSKASKYEGEYIVFTEVKKTPVFSAIDVKP